jgi:hypothetical protein
MVSLLTRSALEFWSGGKVLPDVHHVIIDHRGRHVVTYAEHMAANCERKAKILRRICHVEPWRAWWLYVAYYDQQFYGGWHVMLDRYDQESEWPFRGQPWGELMRLFPLVTTLGSEREQWKMWKQKFAETYQRGTQDGRPRGMAIIWRRGWEIRRENP